MKKEKKLYFEKLRPKMPSVREINQSEDKNLCCSDCLEFWDKVQAQEVYFRQNEIEQKAKELEFNKLQEKLSKEHENDPITIVCAEDKKCVCGHPNGIHNETIADDFHTRHKNTGCKECNCSHYVHCENPTKQQRNRRRFGFKDIGRPTNYDVFIKNNIRMAMLQIFESADDTFCLVSKNNSHEFSEREYYDETSGIFDFYCIHCSYYKSELYSVKHYPSQDWELIA